jgi:hypothetical protein
MDDRTARIEGIPSSDGPYWFYKRGEALPSLVLVGTRNGERVFQEGPAVRRTWFPGEFFVGPIAPPFATPEDLANAEPGRHGEEVSLQAAAMQDSPASPMAESGTWTVSITDAAGNPVAGRAEVTTLEWYDTPRKVR